jgi:WS/DGAT/MGAT family acyltransferase
MSTDLPRRLSALDASFLYFERPTQPLHVASALIFEAPLDHARLVTDFRTRLSFVPRYTERVIPAPLGLAHPTWEPDPDFDLRAHLHRRTLRAPGSEQQLAELCAALYTQTLDRNRPLWEAYLIDGYRGPTVPGSAAGPGGGPTDGPERSVLFTKVHHCMIDGVSGVQLLAALLDPSPTAPSLGVPAARRRRPLPGFTGRLVSALSDRLTAGVHHAMSLASLAGRPRRAMQEIRATADALGHLTRQLLTGAPRTPFNGRLGLARALAWITFPLNDIKTIKDSLGGSVNDVVLAIVSGAMRQVLIDRGQNPDRTELRAIVPVNLREAHQPLKLGNRISLMVAPLPVGIVDPVERLRQVRAATTLLKAGNEPAKTERLVSLLELCPPPLFLAFRFAQNLAAPVNTICTNVPGPPVSLYMQGVRLERMAPFAPLAEPVGLAFAIVSYADTLTIGFTADAALVADLREVVPPFAIAFEELWTATGRVRGARLGPVLPERQRRHAAGAATVTQMTRGKGATTR